MSRIPGDGKKKRRLTLAPHRIRFVSIRAVIFDWGGTLTPWHSVDHQALWRAVCAPHFPGQAEEVAAAILAAENAYWELTDTSHSSATLDDVFARAGITPTDELLAAYYEAWDPHTITDPDVPPCCGPCASAG